MFWPDVQFVGDTGKGKGILIVPSGLKLACMTYGFEKLDEPGTNIRFAASMFSNPVDRKSIRIKSPFILGLFHIGIDEFVMEMPILSYGRTTHALCLPQACKLVISRRLANSGMIIDGSMFCHCGLIDHVELLGTAIAACKSVNAAGESFSAVKLNTIFDAPGWIGITMHPTAFPLKVGNPPT